MKSAILELWSFVKYRREENPLTLPQWTIASGDPNG
jgi:hypothetical protein